MIQIDEAKILIVEDDADIRELLTMYLQKEGSMVITAENGHQAIQRFQQEEPDLILLDVMLPDMTGMEVSRSLRERSTVPILFISYHKDTELILQGLELGDDYVTKPFNPNIVIARVKTLLRRTSKYENRKLNLPNLQIDFDSCEVTANGVNVHLSAKELQLLLYLAGHPNRVFSVSELYEQVWGWDKEGDEWTVTVHIRNLRKKIEVDPSNPQYIRTVKGFGYKFVM